MNELEKTMRLYDDAFVAHFADLDEEELYNKEQELNYSEFKPNTDFENYFQFASEQCRLSCGRSELFRTGRPQ